MTLRYHERGGRLSPDYLCQQRSIEHGLPLCQSIPGGVVDAALSALILESVCAFCSRVSVRWALGWPIRVDTPLAIQSQRLPAKNDAFAF